jgi:ribosomal protein S18 acetylase RimI-like enzyme
VAVHPDHQHRGIARALLALAEERMRREFSRVHVCRRFTKSL